MTIVPEPPQVPGVLWRPADLADAQAISDLQSACFAVDGGFRESASEIAERFESPLTDPSTDSLVAVTRQGAVVASLWSYVVPEPVTVWSVYDDNYIDPDHRSADLRAFALDWWLQRSLERVAMPSLPVRFHQHLYPSQIQHLGDIRDRGFEPSVYFDELRRDLSDPIGDPVVPAGYQIVPAAEVQPSDLVDVRNDAFRDHTGSQPWTLELWESRQTDAHRPEASFAVMCDGEAVAFVHSAVFPDDATDRGYSEGWIDQVGTRRAHRGNGLAAALIRSAMRVFAHAGIEYATLEVDSESPTGAHGLYARLGFERVRGYVDYTLVVEPDDVPVAN